MPSTALGSIEFETEDRQASWRGVSLTAGSEFDAFIAGDVSARLHDTEEASQFEAHLRGLASTGFAVASLDKLLAAEVPEERDWAVGEALAEAYLARERAIAWPWNMARDKRTPRASLPGADLVGFEGSDGDVRLVLGEVKSSTDRSAPPGVMNGRSGMQHQLDTLATNLDPVCQLLKWLLPRCRGTEYEAPYDTAVTRFLESGNADVALFGVLIRDTAANERDLAARGMALADVLEDPTTCDLTAIYIPCAIRDLPARVTGGATA